MHIDFFVNWNDSLSGGEEMGDLDRFPLPNKTSIFSLLLIRTLYKPNFSRLSNLNIGIFMYASVKRPFVIRIHVGYIIWSHDGFRAISFTILETAL